MRTSSGSTPSSLARYHATLTGIATTSPFTAWNIYIRFMPEGTAIPANVIGINSADWFLPESSYLAVVDMLRNEKPLQANVIGSQIDLTCGSEPVGAHELGT